MSEKKVLPINCIQLWLSRLPNILFNIENLPCNLTSTWQLLHTYIWIFSNYMYFPRSDHTHPRGSLNVQPEPFNQTVNCIQPHFDSADYQIFYSISKVLDNCFTHIFKYSAMTCISGHQTIHIHEAHWMFRDRLLIKPSIVFIKLVLW